MGDKKEPEFVFGPDVRTETAVISAAIVDPAIRKGLTLRLRPDTFLVPEHQEIWRVLTEIARLGIDYDHAAAHRLSNGGVKIDYLAWLVTERPDPPDERTLDYFLETLQWEKAKYTAYTGPIPALLEALKDPTVPVEKAQALGEQVAIALRGYRDRRHLHDADELVRRQMAEIRKRIQGQAFYPYGIPGLDFYDPAEQTVRRMTPGAAPGEITVLCAVPGGGKSTFAGHLAIGLGRQRRRVLIGSWEMDAGVTLEILAVLALGWSRTEVLTPKSVLGPSGLREGTFLTADRLDLLEGKMRQIAKLVRFMDAPGVRDPGSRRRRSNDEVLDLLKGYVADVAPDVVIFDLWKRALPNTKPEDEEDALIRLQEMAHEYRFHAVVVHQLRHKDVEARDDPRPTRESLKGSGAYVEVADTIIGLNRPSLWKPVEDDTLEAFILKQRKGKWPLQVNFDWVADTGQVSGGEHVEYDSPRTTRAAQKATGMGQFLRGGSQGGKTVEAIEKGKRKGAKDDG